MILAPSAVLEACLPCQPLAVLHMPPEYAVMGQ